MLVLFKETMEFKNQNIVNHSNISEIMVLFFPMSVTKRYLNSVNFMIMHPKYGWVIDQQSNSPLMDGQ
jgi:hypothetical protein